MWIYLNDRFVKEEEAVVSVFDHGFLYGDGVYETIRSYGSRIFMRDQHLARLRRSADAIGLTIPIPDHRWPDAPPRSDGAQRRRQRTATTPIFASPSPEEPATSVLIPPCAQPPPW